LTPVRTPCKIRHALLHAFLLTFLDEESARLVARAAANPDWRRKMMRNYLAWACATLVLGSFVFGQQPQCGNSPSAQADLTNLLEARIKAEWEAIKKKDQKAYGELLTDDFVAVEADGGGERFKWKALSELQQSSVTDYTLSFLKATTLCSDATFVRYEVFVRFPPKSVVPFEKILVGEIWVKRDGQWKALHYQETRVK
jgi:hypothetical protein